MADQTFGARLKQLREQAGLTQKQLAERVDMNRFSVAKLEQDLYSPTWVTVRDLAKALGVSCAVFEDTVDPPPRAKQAARRGRPLKATPPAEPPGENRKGRKKGG